MLSYPDYEEKQILILSSEDYRDISLRAGNILIKKDGKVINQISCSKVFCIRVLGECTFTTKLIDELLGYNISIYFLWAHLKPKFIIWNQLEWNYLLRVKQYTSDNFDLIQARHVILNKVSNQLSLLKSIRSKTDTLKSAIKQIKWLLSQIASVDNQDSLRWLEWSVSKIFFKNYFQESWWYRRAPRSREDITNLLMDIWYSLLYNFIEAHLQLYGFDIYKWFYHKLFYERKSLLCDIIEPFRSIIDQTIYTSYNLWKINPKDFVFTKGQYNIWWEERKKYVWLFLSAIMQRKKDIFLYVKWYYRSVIGDDITILPIFNI